jgi:hypothetical protein
MLIDARRSRKRGLAGLAVCSALMASTFVANAGASPIPPPAPPPPPGEAVLVKPTDLVISATTSTSVRVRNTGDRSAGPFSIAVSSGVMSTTCNIEWPVFAVSRDVAGLSPGQSKTVTIPDSSIPRTATVDNRDAVAESNELNNTGVIPAGLTIIC